MHVQRGYTLVELVVVMVVLAGVTMLAVPAFQSSVGNSQIRAVAESIHDGLQLARMEAIKRNTKVKFQLASDTSWQYGCDTVTSTCPAIIGAKSASEGSGSGLVVSANASNVVFSSFGTRDPAASSSLSEVNVSKSNLSSAEQKTLRVLLSAGGVARVCDPAVTTTGDPRKC